METFNKVWKSSQSHGKIQVQVPKGTTNYKKGMEVIAVTWKHSGGEFIHSELNVRTNCC